MKIKSWLTGRRGISLPFTDSCVPLNQDLELNDEILPEVLIHGTAAHWRYFECRGGKNFFDGAPASESYYGHELKLQRDVHLLFDRCKSTTRGAVNKALRDGVTVDFSHSEEAMEQFYLLHCRTRRRHGLPPQPPEFFRNIQNYIFDRNMGFVTLATFQKSVIAAAVFFHFGHRAIFKYGASDRSQLHLRGNNLILWETIKWLSENGFESLDFGRTSFADEGLRKFKLGWGTVEKLIDYVRYDFSRREFVTVNDVPHKWRRRFFRALPLALSKSIGTMLYRHAA
jgi:lipid II:glycine glycyltransferase (peptidoglycan interpeptide bridge formation enzyme)